MPAVLDDTDDDDDDVMIVPPDDIEENEIYQAFEYAIKWVETAQNKSRKAYSGYSERGHIKSKYGGIINDSQRS